MGYFFFHHLVTLVLVAVAQFAKRLHLTVKKWCNMLHFGPWDGASVTVWPDWVIFCCLDDFLKPVATTFLAQIDHIIGRFWKSVIFLVKVFFGQLFIDSGQLLTQAFWSPFSVMTTVYRAQAHNQASVLSEWFIWSNTFICLCWICFELWKQKIENKIHLAF